MTTDDIGAIAVVIGATIGYLIACGWRSTRPPRRPELRPRGAPCALTLTCGCPECTKPAPLPVARARVRR